MEDIFPLDKNFCKIFKKKDSPELAKTKLPKYVSSSISKLSLKFAKESYYKLRLCLLHNRTDHLYYFNYPNIEVIDDNGLLFILKIYRLYEIMGMKIADYNSKRDSRVIINSSVKFDKLARYLFILSLRDGKNYRINFTKEENILILAIFGSFVLDFEDETNIDIIFNRYLREIIMTDDFYKNYVGKKRSEVERAVRIYFNKLRRENVNFVENTKKVFRIEFKALIDKLNIFFKTEEYKKFKKSIKIKKFKFPMKEYFGPEKPLQYQFFKKLVDEFENSVMKK